jgi:hypothetical protein
MISGRLRMGVSPVSLAGVTIHAFREIDNDKRIQ